MAIHSLIIQKLLSTNAHLSRHATTHHIKPFLHGTRNSLSILDTDKTLVSLRTALNFLTHLIRHRHPSPPRILFVNTNPLYDPIFDHLTAATDHPLFSSPQSQYWRLGGFLTNSSSPKKFRSRNKKICFAPVEVPDCVVIVDLERKSSVISEACRVGVPIVGLVDSSVPGDVFEKITYPIVCGDSVQFVYLVCNLIAKTFLLEQRNLKGEGADGEDVEVGLENANIGSSPHGEEAKLQGSDQTTDGMKVVPRAA